MQTLRTEGVAELLAQTIAVRTRVIQFLWGSHETIELAMAVAMVCRTRNETYRNKTCLFVSKPIFDALMREPCFVGCCKAYRCDAEQNWRPRIFQRQCPCVFGSSQSTAEASKIYPYLVEAL
jgi:hypothetical protein